MATQTIVFAAPTGRTLVCRLFPINSDTQESSDKTAVERTNRKGTYVVQYTDAPAGDYTLHVFDGATVYTVLGIAPAVLTLAATTGTYGEVIPAEVTGGGGGGGGTTSGLLTLTEAKAHLRVRHTAEDDYISALISAATADVEKESWRAILLAERTLVLDSFPCADDPIFMPFPPLESVASIAYLDANGASQTLAGYRVDATHAPGVIVPAYGSVWPDTYDHPAAVTITFNAGYADGTVPANGVHLIRLRLSELYEDRSPQVSEKRTTFDRLMDKFSFRDQRVLPFILGSPRGRRLTEYPR